MSKSKSGGRSLRQKTALKYLEEQYVKFKEAKQDKQITSRGRNLVRSYKSECERMEQEIQNIKNNLSKSIKG